MGKEALLWANIWQNGTGTNGSNLAITRFRQLCFQISPDSPSDVFDMPQFDYQMLYKSAKTYRKDSKGSDHWHRKELEHLPQQIGKPIAHAIDDAVIELAWPHQNLCNLMPERGKPSGGARCIAKTCLTYRLWARTRRGPVSKWEATLDKPYDTASKKSSALLAAANSSLFAEICV